MKIGIFKFKKTKKAQDPVCLMKVAIDEKALTHNYNGQTYYFCSENCKEEFIQSPQKYAD